MDKGTSKLANVRSQMQGIWWSHSSECGTNLGQLTNRVPLVFQPPNPKTRKMILRRILPKKKTNQLETHWHWRIDLSRSHRASKMVAVQAGRKWTCFLLPVLPISAGGTITQSARIRNWFPGKETGSHITSRKCLAILEHDLNTAG